jgi:hypothetical protein
MSRESRLTIPHGIRTIAPAGQTEAGLPQGTRWR